MAFPGFDDMTITRKLTRSHQKINGIFVPKTITADRLKIEIPINKISATYNKDNKVNKLVTVFAFAPAIKTDYKCRYRDRASASYKTLYTLTCKLFASKFVPRHSYT